MPRGLPAFVVAAAAAAALAVVGMRGGSGGGAFVTIPKTEAAGAGLSRGRIDAGMGVLPTQSAPHSTGLSLWTCGAWVALLGAAATCRRLPVKKQKGGCKLVTMPGSFSHPSAVPQPEPSVVARGAFVADVVQHVVIPDLLDLKASAAPVAAVAPAPQEPQERRAEAAPLLAQAAAPTASPSPTFRRLRSARMAGGSRLKAAFSRAMGAAASSSRSGRRQFGAKLQRLASAPHQVLAPSFDASKVRAKVQRGLRDASLVHSERGIRESKSSAAGVSGESLADELIQSVYFRSRTSC